jgi:hypothetical protein
MEAEFEAAWPSLSTVERQHALTAERKAILSYCRDDIDALVRFAPPIPPLSTGAPVPPAPELERWPRDKIDARLTQLATTHLAPRSLGRLPLSSTSVWYQVSHQQMKRKEERGGPVHVFGRT